MGKPPGRVTNGIFEALREAPEWHYDQLVRGIYGEDFRHSDRASLAGSIRILAARGELEVFVQGRAQMIDGKFYAPGHWIRRKA